MRFFKAHHHRAFFVGVPVKALPGFSFVKYLLFIQRVRAQHVEG
jgi:hypothetical protein